MSRFSQKSLDFLARANRQKKADWLDRNREEYNDVGFEPTRHLALEVAKALKPIARGYRFPTRNFARLRRSGDRARKYGALFREYVGVSASQDSGSRFEDLPGLYFHYSPDDIFSAGGLYMPSSRQIKRVRDWIDRDPRELERVLKSSAFRKAYSEGLGDERVLKTKPRDYSLDHPRIEWLKLTGYYVWRPIKKRDFFSTRLPEILVADWTQALRLNAVLDQYIREAPRETTAVKGLSRADRFAGVEAPQVNWEEDLA